MKIKSWDSSEKSNEIHLDRAMTEALRYLKRNGIVELNNTALSKKEELFSRAIDDYKKGELSLDEFSCLCEKLWWTIDNKNNKLAETILKGAELSFYERASVTQENMESNFINVLRKVMNYKE